MPRAEVGQGITTAVAMTIAEEMDLPLDKVNVTLADARPELVWNQITGGSNTMHSIFTPVRVAAAIARGALLQAAALELGSAVSQLTSSDGVITAPEREDGHLRRAEHQGRRRPRPRRRSAQLKPQLAVPASSARRSGASTRSTS